MKPSKRILSCPLNWGLGHASRCIPIIRYLLNNGHEVIIASCGVSGELLRQEFPLLQHIDFPSFRVKYSKKNTQIFAILCCLPNIIQVSIKEHFQLKKLVKQWNIDMVISDNRFGLWNKRITSVYITHQLMVKMPKSVQFMEPIISRFHRFVIEKYDYCLIPDFSDKESSIAGDLTHKYKLPSNANFIGTISRFNKNTENILRKEKYKSDILIILSGIEPQRSILEKELIRKIQKTNLSTVLIQGIFSPQKSIRTENNITIISHETQDEVEQRLANSKTIICRSGYSNLMDLISLQKSAIIIPTPGQTEQEYLADYLSRKNLFVSQYQNQINIEEGIKDLSSKKIMIPRKPLKLPF